MLSQRAKSVGGDTWWPVTPAYNDKLLFIKSILFFLIKILFFISDSLFFYFAVFSVCRQSLFRASVWHRLALFSVTFKKVTPLLHAPSGRSHISHQHQFQSQKISDEHTVLQLRQTIILSTDYQLIINYLINRLVYEMSENSEIPSQFPTAKGDIFKCFKTQTQCIMI